MLPNRSLEEQIEKIKALQRLQNDREHGESGNLFPDDVDVAIYKTNAEIGKLAFEIYEQIKNEPARSFEAAAYFALALDHDSGNQAYFIAKDALQKTKIHLGKAKLINATSITSAYYQGLCHLLGIGDYIKSKEHAFTYIKYAAKRHYARAQYLLAVFLGVNGSRYKNYVYYYVYKWYNLIQGL